MKFYYNNQLIRTSKTHEYKFALVEKEGDKVVCTIACSATKEGCKKEQSRQASYYEQKATNNANKIKAIEAGKSGYTGKDGRKSYYYKFEKGNKWDTVEGCKILFEEAKAAVKRIEAYEIVELEAR